MKFPVVSENQNVKYTPLAMLYHWENTRPDDVYLTQPVDGEYKQYTFAQVADMARRIAAALALRKLSAGSRIGVFAKNCAEWFILDLGIMMAGHVSVPVFASAGGETLNYVIRHGDIKLLFIGKLDKPAMQLPTIPESVPTVALPYVGIPAHTQWNDFINCDPIAHSPDREFDDIMIIIYTSGSTGEPKGVVHSFRTLCWAAANSIDSITFGHTDRMMSYLPLAHITERVLVEVGSFYSGGQVFFVESLDTFQRDVAHCQPTLFVSVPRLWTKFQQGILAKMPQKKLSVLLKIPFVRGVVQNKIKEGLGLGQTRLFASGSAPLAPAVIKWFYSVGIPICEGWGMTENCAYGTACLPFNKEKIGKIGQPYKGVDITLSDEHEILVKSPCNMVSYYLDPAKTAAAFNDDGYLRTGDKGDIDAEGFVRITGRLKDIFKTEKGKYVTPAPIEARIMENAAIEQVCVVGTGLPQPIALVVLTEEAQKQAKDELDTRLSSTLQATNSMLESHQKLDRILVIDEEWSIDNDLLTPTLKVKRHVLESRYRDVILASYTQSVEWVTINPR
ncbi:AMP-binding protein [Alteromonas sp. C1M14]|uniref:AMP-binding protein n=1 Tax=Alteromonas sp. C1M14 TaxID=2841567 RepID=UPI001C088B36|nr:AMP-binding protein [Alteromonas sp. C1M14]MBU2977152.1 AMP-binding protein [Alteromonas sp. C1M14]